jgi:hypothetical protein
MEAKPMKQVEIEASETPTVYVADAFTNRYGDAKARLEGDTYEAKEAIKSLDWEETHRTWDDELGAWTIDHDALDDLADALEEHGMTLGGVGGRLVDEAKGLRTSDERMWAEHGIQVVVEYDSSQGQGTKRKEGVLSSMDPAEGWIQFKRDDGGVNRVNGDAILAPTSDYPFMGKIERVTLRKDDD